MLIKQFLGAYNHLNMRNNIYKIFILVLMSINAFGQSPDWSVNENSFQYTMSIEGFINVDGKTLSNVNDKVAAFVNGECRGSARLLYVPAEKKYIAYLTVFANVDSEVISFKIYDSATNSIKNVEKTKVFENNKHFGNLFQAYSFASPSLNSSAEIVDFKFKDLKVIDKTAVGSQLTLFVDKNTNVSALNGIFELSLGAKLFVGTINQVSGSNTIDFKNPVEFQVLSEDQSVLKKWTVIVKIGTAKFYKKDAVCYAGGIIKVLYDDNNATVTLSKNGKLITSQKVTNGETIFNNLEVGAYVINVGGMNKEVSIKQKN